MDSVADVVGCAVVVASVSVGVASMSLVSVDGVSSAVRGGVGTGGGVSPPVVGASLMFDGGGRRC